MRPSQYPIVTSRQKNGSLSRRVSQEDRFNITNQSFVVSVATPNRHIIQNGSLPRDINSQKNCHVTEIMDLSQKVYARAPVVWGFVHRQRSKQTRLSTCAPS